MPWPGHSCLPLKRQPLLHPLSRESKSEICDFERWIFPEGFGFLVWRISAFSSCFRGKRVDRKLLGQSIMEFPELSLAPARLLVDKISNSSSSESEISHSRKRKLFYDQLPIQTSVDLHVKHPLPLDWEQCLDLESGKMYYMNRKTLRKTLNWPKENQKMNLELNISTITDCSEQYNNGGNNNPFQNSNKLHHFSSGNDMVALACFNCHLLVILSKASPSCPNCKYVHSLPTHQNPPPKISATKSLNTLSLLH